MIFQEDLIDVHKANFYYSSPPCHGHLLKMFLDPNSTIYIILPNPFFILASIFFANMMYQHIIYLLFDFNLNLII